MSMYYDNNEDVTAGLWDIIWNVLGQRQKFVTREEFTKQVNFWPKSFIEATKNIKMLRDRQNHSNRTTQSQSLVL